MDIRPERGQSLPKMVLTPELKQRPRPQGESAPAVINITRSKKRRRSPDTSEADEKLAEAPDAKRTRGGTSLETTQEFEEPGATTTQNKNQYVVVLAAIGVLTLGAVVYTKGRA